MPGEQVEVARVAEGDVDLAPRALLALLGLGDLWSPLELLHAVEPEGPLAPSF